MFFIKFTPPDCPLFLQILILSSPSGTPITSLLDPLTLSPRGPEVLFIVFSPLSLLQFGEFTLLWLLINQLFLPQYLI